MLKKRQEILSHVSYNATEPLKATFRLENDISPNNTALLHNEIINSPSLGLKFVS